MAVEYTYYGSADLTGNDLRSVVSSALGGELSHDGTVVRPGLSATVDRPEAGDEAVAPQLFGFVHRGTVRFRFANNRPDLEEHNTALMVGVVLSMVDRTDADSVLLFNGEEAVLASVGGEAIFDAAWTDWEPFPEVAALMQGRRVATLPQPLL
jgi:hypothetical protein